MSLPIYRRLGHALSMSKYSATHKMKDTAVLKYLAMALCVLGSPNAWAGTTPPVGVTVGAPVDTNTVLSRTLTAQAQDTINIKNAPCFAVGDGVTDDSAQIATCINTVNTLRSAGNKRVKLYIPPGFYYIKSTSLPTFLYGGQVTGEYHQSYILVDPAYSGDVFSWSEAWAYGTSYTPPLTMATDRAGAGISNITITGTPGGTVQQNAVMFYDRDDFVSVNNLQVFGMPGRCIGMGFVKNQSLSYIRESNFSNIKCWSTGLVSGTQTPTSSLTSGSTTATVSATTGLAVGMYIAPGNGVPDGTEVASVGSGQITMSQAATVTGAPTLSISNVVPAIEISSSGTGDTSNQLKWYGVDLCGYAGSGVVIRNQNSSGKGVSQINFYGLRIEACGDSAVGDQLQFGDTGATYVGKVSDIGVYGYVSNTSTANYASISTYSATISQQSYALAIYGNIPTGAGIGLNVQSGRSLQFHIGDMGTTGTDLVVGSTTLVGVNNQFDGFGGEQSWTTAIDTTNRAQYPMAATFSNVISARSSGSVGESNQPGLYGFTSGFSNRDMGTYSNASGQAVDGRAWANASCVASSPFTAGHRGDSETCTQVLSGSSTASTVRLTADLLTAGTGNVLNLIPGFGVSAVSESCSGYITARDQTNGNTYSWFVEFGAKRPGAANSTVIGWQNVTAKGGDSSLSGITVSTIAADTNAGINITMGATGVSDAVHYSFPAVCGSVQ
jgi:hypothetical protein